MAQDNVNKSNNMKSHRIRITKERTKLGQYSPMKIIIKPKNIIKDIVTSKKIVKNIEDSYLIRKSILSTITKL